MEMVARGEIKPLAGPVEFEAKPLGLASLPAAQPEEVLAFQKKMAEVSRAYMGASSLASEEIERILKIKQAALQTPSVPLDKMKRIEEIELALEDIRFAMNGPSARASWEELPPMDMPLSRRINVAVRNHWSNSAEVTQTAKDQYEIIMEEFPRLLEQLKELHKEIDSLGDMIDELGAGWTPGRIIEL
jgi:hypothetical protein